MPFVVVGVVLVKSLHWVACQKLKTPSKRIRFFWKMIFWRIRLSSTSSGSFFLSLPIYDLISSRGFFHDQAPVLKIDAFKGVDTERATGETSKALTLTCVAGTGFFLRAKEEQQQQQNNRPAPATQVTLTNTSTFSSLNICFRGREGALTDESR